MTTSITVTIDVGEILIRATDVDEDIDVGIPLCAREARSVAAHLVVLAEELDARTRPEPAPAIALEELHSDELAEGVS